MAQPDVRPVPEWDLADRLRKSLRHAGMEGADIARILDVRRETVSRWLNGKFPINTRTLQAWAVATGVDVGWLITGSPNSGDPVDSSEHGPAALAQSAERFTRNEECNGSAPIGLVDLAA